jgi:hypothetical protein
MQAFISFVDLNWVDGSGIPSTLISCEIHDQVVTCLSNLKASYEISARDSKTIDVDIQDLKSIPIIPGACLCALKSRARLLVIINCKEEIVLWAGKRGL